VTDDLILDRIAAQPESVELGSIPWPDGLKPVPSRPPKTISGALPSVDVVVLTYTQAEREAAADVLTPGVHHTDWADYTHKWASYESQLTGRSPARDERCMASVCVTQIGSQSVLVAGSNLHLSTDGPSMPVRQLVEQIAQETGCRLFITTGTAGGVGAGEVLGDVIVGEAVKFNLAKSQWANEPYAQERFPSTGQLGYEQRGELDITFETLIPAAIGDHLKSSGYAPRAPQLVLGKDIETVGYFAFADTADSYGVVKNDPNVGVEEMDDAAVAMALRDLYQAPAWLAVRNASDPQMGSGPLAKQKAQAERLYERFGYYTTVCSALACWAIIAGN
jgi:hypothetical protein